MMVMVTVLFISVIFFFPPYSLQLIRRLCVYQVISSITLELFSMAQGSICQHVLYLCQKSPVVLIKMQILKFHPDPQG